MLQKSVGVCPRVSEDTFLLAEAYLQLKDYRRAKENYEAAIRIDADCTYAYYGLAAACERLGLTAQSQALRAEFQKRKEEDQRREKERLKAFDDAENVRAAVASTYSAAGQVYLSQGDAAKAERLWLKAAALDPASVPCRTSLAALYQQQQKFPQAAGVLEQLVKIEPGEVIYVLNLGIMEARLGRFDAAEKTLQRAVEIAPKRPEGYVALAQLYLRANRNLAEARTLATAATRLAPTAANYSVLSTASEKAGDADGARAAIARAVQLDPENRTYRQRQALIQGKK